MEQANMITVGEYLVRRLEQVGLKHIFGVAGDYVLRFFDLLEASSIDLVATCNELNAGYAADAYARLNGIGGVCVTYGVGGFSVFNAVAGAFAERVPVIIISGGPRILQGPSRVLLHHRSSTTTDVLVHLSRWGFRLHGHECGLGIPNAATASPGRKLRKCLTHPTTNLENRYEMPEVQCHPAAGRETGRGNRLLPGMPWRLVGPGRIGQDHRKDERTGAISTGAARRPSWTAAGELCLPT